MAEVYKMTNGDEIREQASSWLARFDSDRMTPADNDQFNEWLHSDPRHESAYNELRDQWQAMDALAALKPLMPPREESSKQAIPTADTTRHSRTLWHNPLAYGMAALLLVAVFVTRQIWLPSSYEPVIYTTEIGKQQLVTLADNSTVQLNTNTVIEVSYLDDRRALRLIQGEAFFDVAPDTSRPFTVHAGTGSVQALGTAFAVHVRGSAVEVAVTEGKVQVRSGVSLSTQKTNTSERETVLAEAGQIVEYSRQTRTVKDLPANELKRLLAWRAGMLIFKGETLASVIDEITRYGGKNIVIADPNIRNLEIGGRFKIGDTDALLSVLELGFGIRVRKIDEKTIYLLAQKPD